jgi:transcription elongation factor GreA
MADRIPMTPSGYQKLEAELRRLKIVDRRTISHEIEIARAHGDISENAEFHAAKEKQSHIEGRIRIVEDKLARAQIIETGGKPPETVRFGVTVVLTDDDTGEKVQYTITGEDESNVSAGLISVTSPVARALLGKRVGDEVTVRVPKGNRSFEVLDLRFD